MLPLLVSIGFQILFHSPHGVLFTFPSRYYSLSVIKEYLALGDGPPYFPQDFSCLVVLWIQNLYNLHFTYGTITLYGKAFQLFSVIKIISFVLSVTPAEAGLGSFPFARRYLGNRIFSFSSSGYLDVSVLLVFLLLPMYSVVST